jgi:hypothetical protein
MDTQPCPLCGSTSTPKFDSSSAWCTTCAHDTIVLQERLDRKVERHQVFEE